MDKVKAWQEGHNLDVIWKRKYLLKVSAPCMGRDPLGPLERLFVFTFSIVCKINKLTSKICR